MAMAPLGDRIGSALIQMQALALLGSLMLHQAGTHIADPLVRMPEGYRDRGV